ncbi:OpgC domain-containing protein [Kitasatospora sp. NPDC006697]|uniref:OpgC domain-containing protein n=1 Tax=Kitasatospora sp. NPDC006697 TaxID=3364020 RepID=UPI0036CC1715
MTTPLDLPAPSRTARPCEAVAGTAAPRRRRVVALDLMRGYYVAILAAVHLDYLPSLLGDVDGRGSLLVSEAENFFMISGLLVGMLRRRDLERHGAARMARNSWRRAGQLYLVAVALTLLYTGIGRVATAHGHTDVKAGLNSGSSPLGVLGQAATLRYTYGWADFLTFYVPMFLLVPVAIWLLSRRLAAVIVLLAYAGFVLPSRTDTGFLSPFLQWGIYFFLGMAAGYHWDDLRRLAGRLPPITRRGARVALVIAAVVIYAAGTVLLYHPELTSGPVYNELFQDNRLGLLRPVLAAISAAGTYLLIRHFERPLARTIGWVLLPLGRNSLYVYVAQSLVIFLIPLAFGPHGFWFNTSVDLAIIVAIWCAVRIRFLAFLLPGA